MAQPVHIATIISAHGLKGEVKVKSFASIPKAFASYGPLQNKAGQVFTIKSVRPQKDDFLCFLESITDRNQSEALRGVELFVDRAVLPKLGGTEIYLADLEGKEAYSANENLGQIKGFQNFGAGELMELASGLLIPMVFVTSVSDHVELDLPEGYLAAE